MPSLLGRCWSCNPCVAGTPPIWVSPPLFAEIVGSLSQSTQTQAKLFCQWDKRHRAEGVLQPAAEVPVSKQVQTQHGSQIGEGPLRLGEMVQPCQQQHGD